MGKVLPTLSENLRGIVMEVRTCSKLEICWRFDNFFMGFSISIFGKFFTIGEVRYAF